MSIVSEIERIKTNIANAYTTCESKGATMPTIRNSDNLANCISSVTGGSINIDDGYVKNGLMLHLSGLKAPEEENTWFDTSERLNATLYNNPAYDGENKFYSFDGVNQYGIGVVSGMTQSFTIELYYKQDDVVPFDVVLGTRRGGALGCGILNNNGAHYAWIHNGSSSMVLPTADRPQQIAGRKVHTVLSRGSDGIMLFSLKDIERNVLKTFSGTAVNLNVSKYSIALNGTDIPVNDTKVYSKAQIYAIRMYNRKLTNEEMQQNYEQDVKNYGV